MATTTDYLNKLVTQKNTLADNLVTKGVTATHDETLETLIPKVLDISSGSTEQKGVYPLDSGGYPTGDVIIPEGVVTLNSDSPKLNNNQNVTSIELPSTFREFASSACSYARSLTDVTIKNDNYVFFGGSAFKECNALTNIHFTNPNTKVKFLENGYGKYFFSNTNITDSVVEEILARTITGLGEYAFEKCLNLKELTLPILGKHMIMGSSGITKIIVNDGITIMPEGALRDLKALKYIYIPSSIVDSQWLTKTNGYSTYFLYNDVNIETIEVGRDWNASVNFSVSDKLTKECIVNIFNNLKDLSGEDSKSLVFGEVNLAKLTDEEKAIATNKNWILS